MEEGLLGKRVVITGGASGIGLATAQRFVEARATVGILDRDNAAMERVARDMPNDVATVEADVSDAASVAAAFEQIDRELGGVDVLIVNAGISARSRALDIAPEDWDRMIQTNLNGAFYCAREAARRQASNGGGTILMTASTNGLIGYANYAHYNATKAGVIALTRTLARELAPRVRVNAVCPGYVLTPMQLQEYTQARMDDLNQQIPLGRHARPEEVAHLFLFLASDRSAFITGQAIVIDGGELA